MNEENREVLAEDITQADLNSYIAAANSAISPFDLEIRSAKPQIALDDTNPTDNTAAATQIVYALVNTTSDPLTQLATTYTVDEIAFVKRLLDAMFETHNTRRSEAMVLSNIQAIQLAKVSSSSSSSRTSTDNATNQGGAAQSLTIPQAETMLARLVEEGWFEKSPKGFFSLSPRGLMELRGWLVDTYNDDEEEGSRGKRIKFCAACRDIITIVSTPSPVFRRRERGCDADFGRANDVRIAIAQVDYTILAYEASFECSSRSVVLCARPSGRGISMSVRGQ
jgi:hypothetical protein